MCGKGRNASTVSRQGGKQRSTGRRLLRWRHNAQTVATAVFPFLRNASTMNHLDDAAPSLRWHAQSFDALTTGTLHAVMQLRAAVFVVEQQCAYLDIDGKDPGAHHLMAWDGATLAAYARVLAPGVSYPQPSIGRVVTAPRYRAMRLGRELVARSVALCADLHGAQAIQIGAQAHLQAFYGRFGFVATSAAYMEDGIAHVHMVRPPAPAR